MINNREINQSQSMRNANRVDGTAMAGAVCLLSSPLIALSAGRWGTYIGIPGTPVYVTDLLFAFGMILLILARLRAGRPLTLQVHRPLFLFLIICFGGVLFIGTLSADGLSLNFARDAVPFLYLLAIPFYVTACAVIGRDRVIRAATVASSFHTLWYFSAVFELIPEVNVPGIGAPVFSTRGDFDGIVCGINIALLIHSGPRRLPLKLVIAALALAAMAAQGSRAGMVGGLIVLAFSVLGGVRLRDMPKPLAGTLVAVVHFGFAGFLLLVASAPALPEWARGLERALGTDLAETSVQNTTTARYHAWGLVGEHVAKSESTTWLGYGFGSNVVMDSGALAFLSGDPSVRAAHNFFVTWLGVVGWLGAALAVLGLCAIATACWWNFRQGYAAAIGTGVVFSIIAAALIGVLLESPFGYLTLIFFAALTIAHPAKLPHGVGLDLASKGNSHH